MNDQHIMKLDYMTNGLVKIYFFSSLALTKSHLNCVNKNWSTQEVFLGLIFFFFFCRKLPKLLQETLFDLDGMTVGWMDVLGLASVESS